MTSDIQPYWDQFASIQDRYLLWKKPVDPETWLSAGDELRLLFEQILEAIADQQDESVGAQLKCWAATIQRQAAEIAIDLESPQRAIAAYTAALALRWDLETHVGLIRTLCSIGMTEEASRQLTELGNRNASFSKSSGAESAVKLLVSISQHPAVAQSLDRNLLHDMIHAISKRGIDKLILKPSPTRDTRPN